MPQFNVGAIKSKKIYTKTFSNFLGLDTYNNPINVDVHRSPKMKNFIFKDGANRKRSGFVQKALFADTKINGYWEFIDSVTHTEHCIVHAGTHIYKLVFNNDSPNLNEVTRIDGTLTGILDQKSFGIVRSNVLYIFTGENYLMYYDSTPSTTHTWVLQEVTTNAYVPTTRINISPLNSSISEEAPFEDVNMLQPYRYNTLIGTAGSPIVYSTDFFEGSAEWSDYYNKEYKVTNHYCTATGFSIKIIQSGGIVAVGTYTLSSTKQTAEYDSTNATDTNVSSVFEIVDDGVLSLPFGKLVMEYYIVGGFLFFDLKIGLNASTQSVQMEFFDSNNKTLFTNYNPTVYQLDNTSISTDGMVVTNLDTNTNLTMNTDYTVDTTKGQLTLTSSQVPLVDGKANLRVKFKSSSSSSLVATATKIKKCTFGVMFGYNEEQQLFVSGNPDYPNYDWHTCTRYSENTTNNNLSEQEDLTYFSDRSYFMIGNPNNKVSGYTLLNDNALAIHKTESQHESSLWIRSSFLTTKLDSNGNEILNTNGDTYKGVEYSQVSSANGEACVSPSTCKNLNGDKLFLSKNGVFSVTLDSNIKSNERYATLRSKLINNQLLNESNLNNAVSIVFDGKYYLAIGNHIYIADCKYLYSEGDYEWWYWELEPYYNRNYISIVDNVPLVESTEYIKAVDGFYQWDDELEEYAEIEKEDLPSDVYTELNITTLFIRNDKLWFGTTDGRICAFDDTGYSDVIYDDVTATLSDNHGTTPDSYASITFDGNYSKVFNYANVVPNNLTDSLDTIFDDRYVYQVLVTSDSALGDGVYIDVPSDDYDYNLSYHLSDKVYVQTESGVIDNEYTIEFVGENPDGTFRIKLKDSSDNYLDSQLVGMDSVIQIFTKLNGRYDVSVDGTKAQIYDHADKEYLDLVNPANTSVHLLAYVVNPVTAIWWTPVIDLGNPMYSKTLNYITIVPNAYGDGEMWFGYLTKDKYVSSRTEGVDLLDLGNFDLQYFSTDPSKFNRAFSKKVKIKKFNFIQFVIKSTTSRECSINEFMMSYYLTKKNKGVR
jgi:hypothetical protein